MHNYSVFYKCLSSFQRRLYTEGEGVDWKQLASNFAKKGEFSPAGERIFAY